VAGVEFGSPRRGAGFVDAPAPVDDDDLVAAATLVHHRCGRGHILDGCGRRRGVLLQAGSASVQLQEQRKSQPQQNAASAAVQRPAADAHRVRRMITPWRVAAFGSVDDGETRSRPDAVETTSATERNACAYVSPCATVVVRVRARARARRPVTMGLVILFRSIQVGFVTFFHCQPSSGGAE